MTLFEKYEDWCKKEIESVDKWINNSRFCKTKSDILQAQENSLHRMFAVAMFIQTLDNPPAFAQIDYCYTYWGDKLKNLCKLRLTTL